MNETIWKSSVDTAKLLRKELKAKFPGTKFSIRSDYNSIRVSYSGGPDRSDVEAVTDFYRAGGFDGMIDLAYAKFHYMLPDGTLLKGRSSGTVGSMGVYEGYENEMPKGAVEVHLGASYIFVNKN